MSDQNSTIYLEPTCPSAVMPISYMSANARDLLDEIFDSFIYSPITFADFSEGWLEFSRDELIFSFTDADNYTHELDVYTSNKGRESASANTIIAALKGTMKEFLQEVYQGQDKEETYIVQTKEYEQNTTYFELPSSVDYDHMSIW